MTEGDAKSEISFVVSQEQNSSSCAHGIIWLRLLSLVTVEIICCVYIIVYILYM